MLGAAGFSAKAILAKLCYRYGISGFATLTVRMIFSLPLYLIIFSYYFQKQQPQTKIKFRRDWMKIAVVGLFGYYLASWFDFVGLEYISASFERLLLFIYPTIVLLLSLVWLKRRAGKREILALIITYLGIGFAYHGEMATIGTRAHIGAIYIIAAAITYAIYLVATERLARDYSPLVFTSFAILASAVAIIIHGVGAGETIWGFHPMVYIHIGLMAVFCTVLPSLFVSAGIALIGSSRAAIISTLGPVMTIYLAFAVLGEEIKPAHTIGALCVVAGVGLLTIKKKKIIADA